MNDYKVERNHFSLVKSILWEDIIDKLNYEYSKKTHDIITRDELTPPTFFMCGEYLPNSIGVAYTEVCKALNSRMNMHIYTSFGSNASTFGRHNDDDDVIIVQSVGKVAYEFDDGNSFTLNPGDSIFIKRRVYHNPIVLEPRITLSFDWLDNGNKNYL